jgi:hypothetical protein
MTKSTRRTASGLDLRILAAFAALFPGFSAPFALGLTPTGETPTETDEEKKKREEKEKEKEEEAKKKAKAEEDEKKKEEEAKAKGAKPPLSACLTGAIAALKGGTPAVAAAALKTEQDAHAATKATLTQTQADLTTAKASLASTETALGAVCAFLGIKPAEVTGLKADQVHGVLQTKISAQAVEIVAGIGIDPAKAPAQTQGDGQPSTRAELLKQYQSIRDPKAAAAFYAKHEKTLLGD